MKTTLLIALLLLPLSAFAQNTGFQPPDPLFQTWHNASAMSAQEPGTYYDFTNWIVTNKKRPVPTDALRFDSTQWNTTVYFRARMLADFLKQHPLIGMSSKEVWKRLGVPWRSGADPIDRNYPDTSWFLLSGGFNPNARQESFEIAYANGKVIAYRQIAQWSR
jgi:hypothetical protein